MTNHNVTPKQVEQVLRKAILKAQGEGVRLTRCVRNYVMMRDEVVCACAMGCVVIDKFGKSPDADTTTNVMNRLGIELHQLQDIAIGFDVAYLNLGENAWRNTGIRLREEFKPVD